MNDLLFLLACLAGNVYLLVCTVRAKGKEGSVLLLRRLAVVWAVLAAVAWYTSGLSAFLILAAGAAGAAFLAHRLRERDERPPWWEGEHERIDQA